MTVNFYNTLTRQKEEFTSLDNGNVRMYTCGPTVYNYAHIGNYRAYIFEDLLRRYLKFRGWNVVQVQNLTDVDDKTIRAAGEQKLPLREYTKKYIDAFFADLKTLNIEPAEHYPAATDHIPEMINIIQRLLDKKLAYRSDDGSIYFNIARFPKYGQLAHLDQSGLRAGARVDHDEYEKENLADFALWKAWDEKDGDVFWESPWGRGRPGWHIECSAMSMKYLGESFDIHTGGIDNIFPHHEDEIAQSEGATGKQMARYWMHCAHLIVDGKKMSKSLGNFYKIRDIIDRGYSGRVLRYELLATHYRQTLNFSFSALDAARSALERLDEFLEKIRTLAKSENNGGKNSNGGGLPAWADEQKAKFVQSLDDDLNISEALAAMFELIHAGNKLIVEQKLSSEEAAAILGLCQEMDKVLGIMEAPTAEADQAVQDLLNARQMARQQKNWKESDRLRDQIAQLGWIVQDTPQGQKLKQDTTKVLKLSDSN